MNKPQIFIYCLHLADNAVFMAQRNSEWTGHGPVLEQDIAITNISLDYLGQARMLYQLAAELYNHFSEKERNEADAFIPRLWKSFGRELQEDDLAFLRDENQFINLLITELPRGDWAFTILRQFFFSAFQLLQYRALKNSGDSRLAAIADKSGREVEYHLRWSSEWVIRLGDGTRESSDRMKNALADLWMFTGEMFTPAAYETSAAAEGIAIDPAMLKESWRKKVESVFSEAGLDLPKDQWMQAGGKQGRHTEYAGYMLAEMQYLQRSIPNAVW